MAQQASGADALVRAALDAGITVCFANPGTTEMWIVDSLEGIGGVRAVLGLHENVVTGAADGYGRMARKPAMTLLHLGPGLSNGLANLHNAKKAGTPVLNVIGTMATWHAAAEAPLKMDAEGLARTVSSFISEPQSRAVLGEALSQSIAQLAPTATPGTSRVATLLLAHDLQWEKGTGARPAAAPAAPAASSGHAAAIDALRQAGTRGALFLGGDALCEPMLSRLGALARQIGLTLLCANGFARADRGQGRPRIERVPYFPQQAAQCLAKFSVCAFLDAIEPVAQVTSRTSLPSLGVAQHRLCRAVRFSLSLSTGRRPSSIDCFAHRGSHPLRTIPHHIATSRIPTHAPPPVVSRTVWLRRRPLPVGLQVHHHLLRRRQVPRLLARQLRAGRAARARAAHAHAGGAAATDGRPDRQ